MSDDETLTPREHHQRALREKRARLEAKAQGHDYRKDCLCSGCQTWAAVQAAERSRKMAPRPESKVPDSIREYRDKWVGPVPGGG